MNRKDTVNERILHVLTLHGRIPNTELAEKIGLSASACLRRVQELENNGVIKGYRAILDSELLGNGFIAYVTVGLGQHTKASQAAFEQAIADATEVKECHNVTGSFEYILRVETRNLKTYKTFHTDTLGTLEQVSTITTHVVMDSPKDQRV
ncbi:Leucine-responsive regulatory protein [Paraglaciecola mesophila]|uniref:Leucine-responsive regulatory protein n=1 Tax=Paraglaciecola mesophila TaxID=197222 RepID=A0A857JLG7_9ALTE|nr:Lrp/AsnC family transcriptional regulator [Paraglaciecola mesophila]QHJ11841.1 Leucine-responsive regulatory protein [Paraglaciecola mesophila]